MVDQKKDKVSKVVKGTAKKKKTSVVGSVIADNLNDVKGFIITDILIPEAKRVILDVIQAVLKVDSAPTSSARRASNYISYNKYSQSNTVKSGTYDRTKVGYRYDNVIFETRSDANDVLKKMDEILDSYQVVSVADFYDLADVAAAYTDNKYGWTNLRSAEVVNVREGYIIRLPKALPLD